jgi:hypothetical protein
MVTSTLFPIICIAPSPIVAITGRSGCAHFAAAEYGIDGPTSPCTRRLHQ